VKPASRRLSASGNKNTKRRASVGFAEPSHDEETSAQRRSSLPSGPSRLAAPQQAAPAPAPAPVSPKSNSIVAPVARSWEEDFGFVYGPSVIDALAPASSFEDTKTAQKSGDASTGLISFNDDRRMSVSGLASPASFGLPVSRVTSQPATPNPSNISQLLFGSPMEVVAAAPKPAAVQELNRRESLMEFTNAFGSASDIRGPASNNDISNASMESSMDQEPTAQAMDATGSFGAILKSRGVKRQRRDSLGSILRRGVDWETLEEGFQSRPVAELSARIEADSAVQELDADDLIDAARPSKSRRLSSMDLTGVAGGIIGLAGPRSRRTSDVMDLTQTHTSRINLSNNDDMIISEPVVNAGGNNSLSEEDPSNMTLNLTQTFTGLGASTRRFSLGADAGMEQTAAVGGIIGLASDPTATTKRTNRLSFPMEFASGAESRLSDPDPYPGSQNAHNDDDDGMNMTHMGTSRIQLGDLNTRRQSLGMDFTTSIDNNILMAETTGRISRRTSMGTTVDAEFDNLMNGMVPNTQVDSSPEEEDMQMATGRVPVILQAAPAGSWSISDDSNNESSMGTETIEARVNMEANKNIPASPNSSVMSMASPLSVRGVHDTDRRKSVGMEMTGIYGSIVDASSASPVAESPSQRRKSLAMEMTTAGGRIVHDEDIAQEESPPQTEQIQSSEPTQEQESMQMSQQLSSPGAGVSSFLGDNDTAEAGDSMLLSMSLRDELAAMQQETNNTGIVIPASEQTGFANDFIEKSRRESVGALLLQTSGMGYRFPDPDAMDVDEPAVHTEHTALNSTAQKEYELSTPNVSMTMKARAIADFPVATPVGASFSSFRTSLHSGEPMTLERFIFLTNIRFANHRRSSIAPSMQTAVEPRSENAKIHTFFVSSQIAEAHEQLSSKLADEVRGARERIQALEQRVRAAAAQNNIPVFRALQGTMNEREVAKMTHDLTKFKSALKHEVRKDLHDNLTGRVLEEKKQAALAPIAEQIHADAMRLESLRSQQSTDVELLRIEKDSALFRRPAQGTQKPYDLLLRWSRPTKLTRYICSRRRMVGQESPKIREETVAEAQDFAAIVTAASGWKPTRMDANSMTMQLQDLVSVSITLPTRNQSSKFQIKPIAEARMKRSMLEHILPQCNLTDLFSEVRTMDSLRNAVQTMVTRVGRACDLVKETTQLSSLFVASVQPTPAGIRIQSTFSSSSTLNRFHVELSVSAPPAYPYASTTVSLAAFENDFGAIQEDMVKAIFDEQLNFAMSSPLLRIFRALDKLCNETFESSTQ
jgi:hypothetical protein